MCGSKDNGSACCPPAHVFQEKICGNFSNVGGPVVLPLTIWSAPLGDYFEGTFEIFDSASSVTTVSGTVNSAVTTPPTVTTIGPVPPGTSYAVAVLNPTSFTMLVSPGVSGTYCITLYKRVLA